MLWPPWTMPDASAPPSAVMPHAEAARCWQLAGSVYASLSGREHGEQALQDRQAARAWYQRAVDEWHKIEPQKGFTPSFRREMESAAQALASVGAASPK